MNYKRILMIAVIAVASVYVFNRFVGPKLGLSTN
jgi:hypothetical protein